MQDNLAYQEEMMPAGGIADFIMTDEEISALERQEAKEAYGSSGIAKFEDIAQRMASYGRYGDDQVAHVETGELVIPKALIEQDSKLKDSIFDHLRELGVEDPERYVVGSSQNSINPETGMPEFFFKSIKKVFSSVAKSVKKVFKGIGKVLKKAAPIILGAVLTPYIGPIYAGMLSGGIGGYLNGGDLKTALKGAALGGVTGAVGAGLSGGFGRAAGTSFLDGALQGINSASSLSNLSGFSQLGTDIGNLATGNFSAIDTGKFVPDFLKDKPVADPATAVGVSPEQGILPESLAAEPIPTNQGEFFPSAQSGSTVPSSAAANQVSNTLMPKPPAAPNPVSNTLTPQQSVAELAKFKPPSLTDSFKNLVTGDGGGRLQALENIFAPNTGAPTAADYLLANPSLTDKKAQLLANAGKAGVLRTYGPAAVAATGAAAAGGFFDTPDAPTPEQTAAEYKRYLKEMGYPEDYSTYFFNPDGTRTDEGKRYLTNLGPGFYGQNTAFMKEGGDVFPRRTGGIGPDEGVPNQDSVRAMLMPGEFVMTTDAVRGADPTGQGNLNKGINRMYDMMRNLEMRGRAVA